MLKKIPVVDLDDFRSDNPDIKIRLINTIGQAFKDIGFVFIKAPRITEILPSVYSKFQKLVDLTEEVKSKYKHPEIAHQRGWTPPFTEEAIACKKLGDGGQPLPDAKENWSIGPELDPNHYFVKKFPKIYPPNIWPKEVPGLKPTMLRLYNMLFDCGKEVLRAVGCYLEKPDGYFDEMTKDSPTAMRAIHYPPIRPEQVGKIIWACKHTDINLITLLPASTKSGLWIRRRDGKWIPGNSPKGCVIAQVADMLDYLTGGELISTAHEVRAPNRPTRKGRLSAALFIHAHSDFLFNPLVGESEKHIYPPITAGELLMKRLKAIGLA